ncbi:adhesion G protein-coupled receptor E4P, partial [Biomphalaria glabrata]
IEVQLQLLDCEYKISTLLKEGNDPCRLENAKRNKSQVIFIIQGTILAPESLSRTQFEQKLTKNLMRDFFRMNLSPTEFVQLEPIVILRESVFGKLYLQVLCDLDLDEISVYYDFHNNQQEIQKIVTTYQNEREDVLFHMHVGTYHLETRYTRPYEINSLHVSQILFCKFLSFNQTDYLMTINDSVIPPEVRITISLNVTEVHITDNKELTMVDINKNGQLDVCTDLLDMKLKGHIKDYEK